MSLQPARDSKASSRTKLFHMYNFDGNDRGVMMVMIICRLLNSKNIVTTHQNYVQLAIGKIY